MPAQNSYEYHLQLLEGLKQNLVTLKSYMETLQEKYDRQINAMHSAGFYDNYIEPLQNRYAQFEQKMNNLQSMIDSHRSIIEMHEDRLNQLIDAARMD